MDIGSLSMAMSQSSLSNAVSISLMKMSMETGKQNATNMTEMLQNCAIDPNRGQILDVRV